MTTPDYDRWIKLPSRVGCFGWEDPALDALERWWAWWGFEELPELKEKP